MNEWYIVHLRLYDMDAFLEVTAGSKDAAKEKALKFIGPNTTVVDIFQGPPRAHHTKH